jgi:hypothetical protein
MTTPKQDLTAHLEAQHAYHRRGNHAELTLAHRHEHDGRHLTHLHQAGGWGNGAEQIEMRIFLSPPKNPSASRNGDRNWTLTVAMGAGGWRYELLGTSLSFPGEAKDAASKILGWKPDWTVKGWGFEVKPEAMP